MSESGLTTAEEELPPKKTYDPDGILSVALDLCEGMLESGAEIHRIEDTAERICKAYGAVSAEIYGMTSLILVTITMPDDEHYTQARRVYYSSNNMQRIEQLNALSRLICRDTPDPIRVKEEIRDIRKKRGFPKWFRHIGGFIGALGFALFFGGTVWDALLSGLIGQVVCYLDMNKPKYLNSIAYTVITSGATCAVICLLERLLGTADGHINTAIISASVIMLMIPGMALGNAIRELLCGEVVSGAVKIMQTVLVAVAIAAGFTGVLFLFGSTTVYSVGTVEPLQMILYAGVGTLGFSILFGVPTKKIFYAVLGGMLCHAAYMAIDVFLDPGTHSEVFIASLVAGAAITCYSETMARICKTPTTVFLIPGLIPLVPGCSLYYTMAYLVSQNNERALSKGLDTLFICLGISVGIVTVTVVFQVVKNTIENFTRKKNKTAPVKLHFKG